MKYLALIGIWSVLALAGCGDNGSANESTSFAGFKPNVPHGRPEPERFFVKNLKEGSGRGAKVGDELIVAYTGYGFKTGRRRYHHSASEPLSFQLGDGFTNAGWERGLKGIKIGGRRLLIIPSRMAYGTGALVYVVELISLK